MVRFPVRPWFLHQFGFPNQFVVWSSTTKVRLRIRKSSKPQAEGYVIESRRLPQRRHPVRTSQRWMQPGQREQPSGGLSKRDPLTCWVCFLLFPLAPLPRSMVNKNMVSVKFEEARSNKNHGQRFPRRFQDNKSKFSPPKKWPWRQICFTAGRGRAARRCTSQARSCWSESFPPGAFPPQ